MIQKRTYSELIAIPSFEERFRYLLLDGVIGEETFGWNRCLNQSFYSSSEWRRVRDIVITRDNGCDLAHLDYPISGQIMVHHLNPITIDMLRRHDPQILNPEYLVAISRGTHTAITYNDTRYLERINPLPERSKYDTCPWRISK